LKIKLWLFLAGAMLLQGCATTSTPTISAVATRDQKVGYGNTIVSTKKHFVSFSPYTQLDTAVSNVGLSRSKIKFMLTVENDGADPIDFSEYNISVVFTPDASDIKPTAISVQAWKDFADEMDSEYDKNERKYLYSKLNELYMESELGEDITEKLSDLVMDIESMRTQNDVIQEMLPAILIKQQRILPGKSYSGVVICDTSDLDAGLEGNFLIVAAVDNEEHRFVFRRALNG
jgi:hypothetical protein